MTPRDNGIDYDSDDGIGLCRICGNYTSTGSLCRLCREQEAIDAGDYDDAGLVYLGDDELVD